MRLATSPLHNFCSVFPHEVRLEPISQRFSAVMNSFINLEYSSPLMSDPPGRTLTSHGMIYSLGPDSVGAINFRRSMVSGLMMG